MDGVIITTSYENKLLQKAVRYFKYHNIKDLKFFLGNLLVQRLQIWLGKNYKNYDFILVPIPLHKKKQKLRGYNQAELLSEVINAEFGFPIDKNILIRIKNTSAQAQLDPLKRRKNIKGAFQINDHQKQNDFSDKKIILVDDICTTSATLEECAKELSKLHPKEILGLVLARGQ